MRVLGVGLDWCGAVAWVQWEEHDMPSDAAPNVKPGVGTLRVNISLACLGSMPLVDCAGLERSWAGTQAKTVEDGIERLRLMLRDRVENRRCADRMCAVLKRRVCVEADDGVTRVSKV
jgi:hypothetical protein